MSRSPCKPPLHVLNDRLGQTASHCAWQALPDVNWVTITSGSPAIGSGSITFTVAPNPTSVARRGRIAVGMQVFTVKQMAATN